MSEELIVEDGPITRLTINRPERHNAINTEVGDEMVDVVNRVGATPRSRSSSYATLGGRSAPATT